MDNNLYSQLQQYLQDGQFLDKTPTEQKQRIRRLAKYYFLRDNRLYLRVRNEKEVPRRVLVKNEIEKVLYNAHTSPLAGHRGLKATIKKVGENFFWPAYGEDIRKYIETCNAC